MHHLVLQATKEQLESLDFKDKTALRVLVDLRGQLDNQDLRALLVQTPLNVNNYFQRGRSYKLNNSK